MLFNYSIVIVVFAIRLIEMANVKDGQQGRSFSKILSRKRRYLIFPIGSSVQIGYDQDVTIPDYANYLMTGVTVALSYRLPDQPSYPDLDYESGDIPLLITRKDENITNIDGNEKSRQPKPSASELSDLKTSEFEETLWKYFNYLEKSRRPDSYYFGDANATYVPYSPEYAVDGQYDLFGKYLIDSYLKRRLEPTTTAHSHSTRPSTIKSPISHASNTHAFEDAAAFAAATTPNNRSKTSNFNEFMPVINKLHTVYPAIGKRSARNSLFTYEDKFYMDHHRATRHGFYNALEKYLSAYRMNGTTCVLKTLCEVGQKRDENEPGTFLAEIIRIVFSLPDPQLKRPQHKRHIEYDEAHQNAVNCTEAYSQCPNSVWSSWFMMESMADLYKHMH